MALLIEIVTSPRPYANAFQHDNQWARPICYGSSVEGLQDTADTLTRADPARTFAIIPNDVAA